MKTIDWIVLYCFTLACDIGQPFIDVFLPGPGEVVNEFLDVAIGAILGGYFYWRGVSMAKPGRILTLIGTFFFEELVAGSLPLWILDVAMTHWSVHSENRRLANTVATATAPLSRSKAQPLNIDGRREPGALMSQKEYFDMLKKNGAKTEKGAMSQQEYMDGLKERHQIE